MYYKRNSTKREIKAVDIVSIILTIFIAVISISLLSTLFNSSNVKPDEDVNSSVIGNGNSNAGTETDTENNTDNEADTDTDSGNVETDTDNNTDSPLSYHLSSVDELPSDAADGSLAMVESNILGVWEFNGALSNFPPHDGYEDIYFRFPDTMYNSVSHGFAWMGSGLCCWSEENDSNTSAPDELFYDGPSEEFNYGNKIEFITDTTDTEFIEALKADATRISGGYVLYSRENGEWVCKGEI